MVGRVNHTDPTVQQRVIALVSQICAEDVPIQCSRRRGAVKRVESPTMTTICGNICGRKLPIRVKQTEHGAARELDDFERGERERDNKPCDGHNKL